MNKKRDYRKEQLRTYSGFQIPKTVVTRYLKGDSPDLNERKKAWSIDTLIKSIEKHNKDKIIKNDLWKEKLKSFETDYPGKTRAEVFEQIQRETRAVDFFADTDISYGAALNQALTNVDDEDQYKKKLAALGKHVDFTEWRYNETNQMMEFYNVELVDGKEVKFLYQVQFSDVWEGDYKNGALIVKKERAKI